MLKAICLLIGFLAPKSMVFSGVMHRAADEETARQYESPALPAGVIPAEPMAVYPRNQKVRIHKSLPRKAVERVTVIEPVKTYTVTEPVDVQRVKKYRVIEPVSPVQLEERS